MKNFEVLLMPDAESDFFEYIDFITDTYKSPLTAKKHYNEISDVIKGLSKTADSFAIQTRRSIVDTYGPFVRRVNYKKMAILYIVRDNKVYVLRIIAQSMISGLY